MIIGLTGTFSAGKDTAAEYLERQKGFQHISTGDIIREHARARGLPVDRDTLIRLSNEIRAEKGPGIFGQEALARVTGNAVVSGLRNVKEVEFLKSSGQPFLMIAIDAPAEMRWQRAIARRRLTDDVTLEKFRVQEEIEAHNPYGQQIRDVIALAYVVIQNDGGPKDLYWKIEEALRDRL